MKPSSAKSKGRVLQNKVREQILARFDKLRPDDVKVAVMGEKGEDIHLSPFARTKLPISIECKNTEKFQVWEALKQAEANAGEQHPVVVFKRNRSKTYAVIEWELLLELLWALSEVE